MKIFSKKPIDLIIDDYYLTLKDNQLLASIHLFENVVKLKVKTVKPINLEKLFEQLNPSINYVWVDIDHIFPLGVYFYYPYPMYESIPNDIIANLSELRVRVSVNIALQKIRFR